MELIEQVAFSAIIKVIGSSHCPQRARIHPIIVSFTFAPRGPCDVLKEYFGNLPMRNDGTMLQTQSFLITETQMAILTDVTLQPDYTCCLRVMGENPALQKLLFDHLASMHVFDYCKY